MLEQEGVAIGVVEKIAAPSTLHVELTGVGGHAGAVLMPERHDALLAGAEIALAVEESALTPAIRIQSPRRACFASSPAR